MNRKSVMAVVWMAVLIAVYLTPLAGVLGAPPPQPVPNVAPQFSNIETLYPLGQTAAKSNDNIFVTLKAWDTDSAAPTIRYSNVPIGGSTANKVMWDDGKHVDGSANDTIYGADSMDSISVGSPGTCDYYALPITIVSAPDTVVTSAPVTVDNSKPILKEMKIEYPPNQLALKTGDPVRIVTNTTDVCIPTGPVKIPIGGMYFVASDLSKIGGKPTEGMYDDGQHGDGAIKDGVYATPQVAALSQDPANEFTVPVIGIDIAGNRVIDQTLKVKIDNTPPVVTGLSITPGTPVKDGDKIKVSATVTDGGPVNGIYRVYVDASAIGGDNQAPMLGSGTYTSGDITVATGGAIGRFKVKVVAIDIAGNKGEQEVNVQIDNGIVGVKIAGLIADQIIQGIYTFRAVTVDAVQVKISINGDDRWMAFNVTNGTWEYALDTTALADSDSNTVTVTAYGEFGTTATDSKTFKIDNHAPIINVLAPPSGSYVEGSLDWSSSSLVVISDPPFATLAGEEFSIDGLGWRTLGSWDSSKVGDGPHTVHFRAWDKASHYTYAELSLVIDNTPPTAVKVQVPEETRYITGEWGMMFDAYDKVGVSTVSLTFDKGKNEEFTVNLPSTGKYFEFTLNTSRFNYDLSKYPTGEHTYDVTVHDKAWEAANIDETYVKKATHENFITGKFKVDNIAPSIISGSTALGNNTPQNGLIVLLFTVTDNPNPGSGVAKVEIRIDNGDWMDLPKDASGFYNYSWRTGKKDNGLHKVEIRATDKLDHMNIQAYSLSIDNTDTSSMILALVGALVFVTLLIFAFLFHRVKAKAIRETPPPPPPQPRMKKSSGGDAQ